MAATACRSCAYRAIFLAAGGEDVPETASADDVVRAVGDDARAAARVFRALCAPGGGALPEAERAGLFVAMLRVAPDAARCSCPREPDLCASLTAEAQRVFASSSLEGMSSADLAAWRPVAATMAAANVATCAGNYDMLWLCMCCGCSIEGIDPSAMLHEDLDYMQCLDRAAACPVAAACVCRAIDPRAALVCVARGISTAPTFVDMMVRIYVDGVSEASLAAFYRVEAALTDSERRAVFDTLMGADMTWQLEFLNTYPHLRLPTLRAMMARADRYFPVLEAMAASREYLAAQTADEFAVWNSLRCARRAYSIYADAQPSYFRILTNDAELVIRALAALIRDCGVEPGAAALAAEQIRKNIGDLIEAANARTRAAAAAFRVDVRPPLSSA